MGELLRGIGLDDVNAWVDKKTEGKVPRTLEKLDPSAAAVLLNAIYFKAHWAETFSRRVTKNYAFHLTAPQQVEAPMMHQTSHYAMATRQGYRAIRLPYDVGALAMIVALPDEVEGLPTGANAEAPERRERRHSDRGQSRAGHDNMAVALAKKRPGRATAVMRGLY
jgi:serine protease inhibitor